MDKLDYIKIEDFDMTKGTMNKGKWEIFRSLQRVWPTKDSYSKHMRWKSTIDESQTAQQISRQNVKIDSSEQRKSKWSIKIWKDALPH